MQISTEQFHIIQSLVGQTVTEENLKFVDCFIHSTLSMFIPIGGNCGYAITPNHEHPAYMFVLSYDSETTVVLEDQKISSEPDTLFCLSPDIPHHEIQNYLPPKYCAIFIEKNFFESQLKYYQTEKVIFDGETIPVSEYKLDALIKEFTLSSYDNHLSKESIMESLAVLLTHEIIRLSIQYTAAPITDHSKSLMVNKTVKYINLHYEQAININDLASHAEVSKSHFSKLFQTEMGISPIEYLKTVRLNYAKRMLLTGELTITQISQQCGFNSPAYFTKSFKALFNETPKAFLKRQK